MAYSEFWQKGDNIDYTPAAAKTAGDVVVQKDLVGSPDNDIAASALGAIGAVGVRRFAKASGAISAGHRVYWDAANLNATRTAAGNKLLGLAILAAGSSDTWVYVLLTPGLGSAGLIYSAEAASAAISNTTTQTAFDKSVSIPANTLQEGDIIRVKAQGIATATNSTDTLNVTLRIGTVDLVTTGALDVADNDIFTIEADLVVRTIGASGTFVTMAQTNIGTPGTATTKAKFKASTTLDTTAAASVNATATWSVASASNSCRLDILNVELIRK